MTPRTPPEEMTDHEIDALHTIKELKERVWLLEETICELLIYASPASKLHDLILEWKHARKAYQNRPLPGWSTPVDSREWNRLKTAERALEDVNALLSGPMAADRIAQIRVLVTPTNDVTEKDET